MDGFGAILPIVGAYEESVPPARVRRARGVRMSKPIRFRCASRWWSLVTSGTLAAAPSAAKFSIVRIFNEDKVVGIDTAGKLSLWPKEISRPIEDVSPG